MAGTLPLGLTARNDGWCCSPLLVSTSTSSYASPELLQDQGDLGWIGRRVEIEEEIIALTFGISD
jgi:hypothetical protein